MRLNLPDRPALRLGASETAVAVRPVLAGRVDAGAQRRMNPFAGRALTAPLLTAEQNHRSLHIALLHRALSAGVVEGLGLGFDDGQLAPASSAEAPPPAAIDTTTPRWMTLEAGLALCANGEDAVVPQALRFDALDLPLRAPAWMLDGTPAPTRQPEADGRELDARALGLTLRQALAAGRALPRAGVVLLEPVEHWQVAGADPLDQCERDLDAEAFEDQQRVDAARLVFYPWPDEWLPLWAPDGRWRNRLAHALFARETTLAAHTALPWWGTGVPLALLGFNAAWQPLFADRAAVVRSGGRPIARAPLAGLGGGNRFLWQARIEQLTEHLSETAQQGADTPALGAQIATLPPAGLLPLDAVQPRQRLNHFFPPTFDLVAAPVPLEQLDLLLEHAAPLAPLQTAARERVAVYVPVPQAVFEPDLLVIERPDPTGEIASTLNRFVDTRSDWLRRRQNLREKQFLFEQLLRGRSGASPVPSLADDPLRLEDETAQPAVPAPAGLLHRSALAQGMHQHVLDNANPPLTVPAGATLYAWALIDREHPPEQLMLQWFNNGWEHRAFWGADRIAWGQAGTASRRQVSTQLPEPGVWTRLTVNADSVGLGTTEITDITGIAFTLHGGRACFGPAGVLNADGEQAWLTDALLKASRLSGAGESWNVLSALDADAPFEDAFGTSTMNGQRVPDALLPLLIDNDFLTLKVVPPGADRDATQTVAQRVSQQGLIATLDEVAARINEADDAVNLGYLRVQTDLYRLRQSVLKQSQASRFAVSPALTQIADLDNASATRDQLAGFYQEVKAQQVPARATVPVFTPKRTAVAVAVDLPRATVNAALLNANVVNAVVAANAGLAFNTRALDTNAFALNSSSAGARAAALAGATGGATTVTVTDADALSGKAEVRTTSIASRMERPRSVEAKDFTVATRMGIASTLGALGLDMDELPVHGVAEAGVFEDGTGQPKRGAALGLAALRKSGYAALGSDPDPRSDKVDEAGFFLSGVDLSDFSVALLRNTEGRVARYRTLLTRLQALRSTLDNANAGINQRLGVLNRELLEARQDVATARALMAEEVARAQTLNARRDQVIAEHVQFLAYARPRVLQPLATLPMQALASSLEPDAVPACLADHGEPPDDVRAMLAVLRQAPLGWFPDIRRHLVLLDQPLLADRFIATLRPLTALAAVSAVSAVSAASTQAITQAAAQSHSSSVLQVRASLLPGLQAALSSSTPLQTQLTRIAEVASVADLMGTLQAHSELQRRSNQTLAQIEAVASCLHARLSGVRAALRLQWAEQFGQLDTVGDLGDLSGLPRFGELPRDDREDISALARWLRARADASNPRAVALVRDLVRVCLLAAAHAPSNQLITGRLLRPLPLFPGIRFDVLPSVLGQVRLGMTAHVFEAGVLTARAVVDDLGAGQAMLRVTHTPTAGVLPSAAAVVHFVNG